MHGSSHILGTSKVGTLHLSVYVLTCVRCTWMGTRVKAWSYCLSAVLPLAHWGSLLFEPEPHQPCPVQLPSSPQGFPVSQLEAGPINACSAFPRVLGNQTPSPHHWVTRTSVSHPQPQGKLLLDMHSKMGDAINLRVGLRSGLSYASFHAKLRIPKSSVFSLSRGVWTCGAAKLPWGCITKQASLCCRGQVWKERAETDWEGPCRDWNLLSLNAPEEIILKNQGRGMGTVPQQ